MKVKKFTNEEIQKILREHNDILKKYQVKKIGLFGSYSREEQKKNSDIDLLVEFENPSFDNFMDLIFYLEDLFNRKIDILTPDGIKGIRIKKVVKEIERSIIYV